MKKSISKRLYDEEEDIDQTIIIEYSLADYFDEISNLEDNIPDRRTLLYQKWKKKINKLIDECNFKFGNRYVKYR